MIDIKIISALLSLEKVVKTYTLKIMSCILYQGYPSGGKMEKPVMIALLPFKKSESTGFISLNCWEPTF